MIKILLFFVSVLWATSISAHPLQKQKEQKGEKQMATLIKAERWVGNNIREVRDNIVSGGWRGDTNGFLNSYHLVTDPDLGNVLYEEWTRGTSCPDGGCNTIAYDLTREQFREGVTFHGYVKLDNIVSGRMGSHWHLGVRGNAAAYTGNGGSQFLLEHGTAGGRGPDNGFFVMTTGSGGERVVTAGSSTNYMRDGVWYEFAWYIHQPSQLMRVHYRPLGSSNWTRVLNATNGNVNSPTAPWLGFGPYIHGYSSSWGRKRVYYGPCNFYVGDAYEDGNLPGEGGGTDPEVPEVPGNDDPVISEHNVKTSDTSAVLSWKTDRDTNAVVDYGDTDARGTIVRDSEMKTDHRLELNDLTPSTTYYYRFSSRDADGNTTMDPENSTFATLADAPVEPPVEPEKPEPTEVALNDLTDVNVPSPAEGDALVFVNGKWQSVNLQRIVDNRVNEILGRTKLVVS